MSLKKNSNLFCRRLRVESLDECMLLSMLGEGAMRRYPPRIVLEHCEESIVRQLEDPVQTHSVFSAPAISQEAEFSLLEFSSSLYERTFSVLSSLSSSRFS